MGKALGGGSSINVQTWSRGHQADWDFCASASGDPAWAYDAVLDLYRGRIKAYTGYPDPDYRGTNGTVHVQPAPDPHPFSLALLEGAESAGLQRFPNPNGRMMEGDGGCALVDETVRNGQRQSVYLSYVYPLMAQPNITVLTGALAARIIFDRRRAIGVEFHYQGRTVRAEATREVILSLGAIHTPKLLMQSGIGEEAELKRAGIAVRQVSPGVGRNLHDHPAFGCIWERTDRAVPGAPRSQTACFWKTSNAPGFAQLLCLSHRGPDATPENAARFKPPAASWSLAVGMRPRSRGAIHLTGPDPAHPARVDANYLEDPQDMKDLIAGLEVVRQIGNSAALHPFRRGEVAPGPLHGAELERFFRDGLGTFWHQSGTAKMGRDGDRADSSVCAVDERTLARKACGHIESTPDGVVYVAPVKEVWVTAPGDNSVRILDSETLSQKEKLTFEGRPEGYAVDAKRGRLYMNYEDKDLTTAIDLKTHKTVAKWQSSCGEDGPHGLSVDQDTGYLFVACSTLAEVLDAGYDGKKLSSINTGDGVDDLNYSPATHMLYVGAAKDSRLTVARVVSTGNLSQVAVVPTHEGTRNGVVTKDGTVYLAHSQLGKLAGLVVVLPSRK